MEEEKNNNSIIWHKVEPNHKYRIWRKDYNGKTYYNIMVEQKNYDDTKSKYYIPILFKKGIEVQNGTDIKIIKAVENIRPNTNVQDKVRQYCPIFSYTILEFEIVEREELVIQNAYDEYRDNLENNDYVTIADEFLD